MEAPSSSTGVLPLAQFTPVNFSGASATIAGSTGSITTFPYTTIDMVSASGAVEASPGGLSGTTTTSSFTVTYYPAKAGVFVGADSKSPFDSSSQPASDDTMDAINQFFSSLASD